MSPEAMIAEAYYTMATLWITYFIVEILYRVLTKKRKQNMLVKVCAFLRPLLILLALCASLFTPTGAILFLVFFFLTIVVLIFGK